MSGVVLAGGKSRRLGIDKSLLRINGEWITERVVRLLATLTDDIVIVSNDVGRFDVLPARTVPDVRPGLGPLGGIYSGLRAMHHDGALVVACDMPLLNAALLRRMHVLSAGCDVVIPRVGDDIEPLHAFYGRSCLPAIERVLDRGELRVASFLPLVHICFLEGRELDDVDPEHLSFFNINTPADLARAEQLLAASPSPANDNG